MIVVIFDFVARKFPPELRSYSCLLFYYENITPIEKVYRNKVVELNIFYQLLSSFFK